MHRRLTFFLILIVTLLVQLTVSPEIGIGSVRPDVILVVTLCWALLEGAGQGALFGFFGGLLEGIFSTAVLGVGAFSKTILGYFCGELRQRVVSKSVIWPMIIIFFGSILSELIKFSAWAIVGLEERPPLSFGIIVGFALYNAVITLLVYPVISRFAEREEKAMMFQ
ncbi:MAG: rod shape-determining protein MreD [Actinomycetota bacterium]|nr:rod shape-determining protein MreD [Actinomycetota bacterium]